MRREAAFFLVLAACGQQEGKYTFTLAMALDVPVGLTILSQCRNDRGQTEQYTEATCIPVGSGDNSVDVPVMFDERVEKLTCTFTYTLYSNCSDGIRLLEAQRQETLFAAGAEAALTVNEADWSQAFDDDGDGVTNYTEHIRGSNPRDGSSVPL